MNSNLIYNYTKNNKTQITLQVKELRAENNTQDSII